MCLKSLWNVIQVSTVTQVGQVRPWVVQLIVQTWIHWHFVNTTVCWNGSISSSPLLLLLLLLLLMGNILMERILWLILIDIFWKYNSTLIWLYYSQNLFNGHVCNNLVMGITNKTIKLKISSKYIIFTLMRYKTGNSSSLVFTFCLNHLRILRY